MPVNVDKDVEQLRANLPNLSANNHTWAVRMIEVFDKQSNKNTYDRFLSDKQYKIVNDLKTKNDNSNTAPKNPNEVEIKVGSFAKLNEMFDKSKKHLKLPAIIVNVVGVGEIMIGVPINNNNDGELEVCTRPRSGYKWKYRGSVIDDTFYGSKYSVPSEEIISLLKDMSSDPIQKAIEYGKNTGMCCFCNSALSDERSLKAGFGKTCAHNWGLKWG